MALNPDQFSRFMSSHPAFHPYATGSQNINVGNIKARYGSSDEAKRSVYTARVRPLGDMRGFDARKDPFLSPKAN